MKNPLQFIRFLLMFLLIHQFSFGQQVNLAKTKDSISQHKDILVETSPIEIQVIPNPSHGLFKVTWQEYDSIERLKIVNALGELVSNEFVYDKKEQRFDLSNQPGGLYLLKVVTQNTETLTKIYLEE